MEIVLLQIDGIVKFYKMRIVWKMYFDKNV